MTSFSVIRTDDVHYNEYYYFHYAENQRIKALQLFDIDINKLMIRQTIFFLISIKSSTYHAKMEM